MHRLIHVNTYRFNVAIGNYRQYTHLHILVGNNKTNHHSQDDEIFVNATCQVHREFEFMTWFTRYRQLMKQISRGCFMILLVFATEALVNSIC